MKKAERNQMEKAECNQLGRRTFLKFSVASAAAGALWSAAGSSLWAQEMTKIAPGSGDVGDEFVIIDLAGRLAAGALAVFHNPAVDSVSVPLTTHRPQKVGRGVVPAALLPGVIYLVSIEVNGQSFDVGTFQLVGVVYAPPSITPAQGPVGSLITIVDARQRIELGDEAHFFLPGVDPLVGTPATGTIVSADGSQLTAYVPDVTPNMDYLVAVISTAGDIRFQDLSFYVTF